MQFPLSMCDYQLLGDGYGYHPNYPPNSNPGGPNIESQPPGSSNAVMASMMSSSAIGGNPAYGMIPPHGSRTHGLPQRSLPSFGAPLPMPPGSSGPGLIPGLGGPGGLGDASKMHDPYASGSFTGGSSQSAMRGGHYPSHGCRYGHSNSGYPVPMGSGPGGSSSLSGMSQHNGGIVPQSSLASLPSSNSYQARGLMSGYNDQRMLSPILGPGPGGGYPGSYASYGSGHSGGTSARIWHSHGMNHVQQRPPYGYNTGNSAPSPLPPHSSHHNNSRSGQAGQQAQQQLQQSQSQVQSTRSSYYNSSSGRVGASSSLSSFIPSEASSMSPYLPSSYNSQNGSVSQGNSGSSRLPDTISSSSGSNSVSRQSHYTGYSSNGHGSSVASGTLGMLPNTSGSMNYPGQQYQAYNVSQGYSDNSSRLSPYTMNSASSTPGSVSTAGQNTVPNSPGYRSPFNTSPYPPSKVSSGNISSSGSMNSNSSCMVAAAAAAANSNSSNVPVNYLQHNLTPSGSADSEACLSNISNLPLTISDTIFNGSKMNESQMNNNADPVITSEPTLNSVFNGSDIEFSSLNFPTVEASAAANYAQQMRIDGTGPKKKKERSKKHKKKDKNKSIDRISMHPNSNANLNNNLSLFPYHQANSHYHDNFSNPMNQSCNNFEQSHHQNPAHPSMFLLSLFLPQSKSSSTLYSEPNSTSNQQLQVPQTQASSISQSLQPTGPPPSISETQSSHLQSKPNIMPPSEMVPRASPACFDTTALNNLQSDLLNGALGDQLSNTGSRHSSHSNHSNHTNSSLDYPKSHADDASQSIIAHHNSENNNCAASSNLGTTDNDNHNNHINSQIPEKFSSLEDELSFLAAAEECESSSQNEINSQVGPQIISNSESHGIPMDRHQQPQQTPQSSAAPVEAQPTLTNTPVSSTSSCMVQSASVSTISVPCVVDSILTNSCAISDDQLTIKSTTTTNSKGYQTDFIPNHQQRISPIASEIGIDVNNVENKINNESGLVKKKKKSKESKAKIFCPQKIIQGQSSTCNNKKANSVINIVPVHNDNFNKMTNHLKNKSLLSHVTTCKPVEVTNIKKSIDMKDHEGKFFKIRPASNTTTIMTLNTVPEPGIKTNCKVIKKRKLEDAKEQKSAVDEYEFPDSPTHSSSAKKVKKINLENSKKKVTEKLLSNNNCSITINKKVSIKPKLKVNQSFTGNTASTRLNISEKTEIINIDGPRPKNMNEKSQFNKIQIEEKVLKIQEKKQHVNNFNNDNHNQHANTLHHQSPRLHKDSSKVTSITVQEILPSSIPALSLSSSQSSNKNITSTINIVSLGKKSTTNGSNQSKKESISRSNVINHHPAPTNTLTTIVPITSNTLNTSIIIANPPTSNPTTAITQQPQIHLPQPVTAQPQQSHHISPIKNFPNQNILMQSTATNTPRRRSQDKKALTIREGLMRTGDFVVSFDESESELPMIWRIEGKSLLQRFEPSEQDGQIVYTNTSSYSAWNPTVKQRYTGVDVRIVGCNRTKIVVEKLGLTRTNTNYDRLDSDKGSNGPNIISNGEITVEKCKTPEEKEPNNFQHQADFEVFIQTLISQALDANFISEIIKENDEYFLSHIQAIDDFCNKKKSRFFTKVKWDAHIVKCVETFSKFNVIPQSQVGDLRCRLCHDNWSTQILHFTGKTYDQVTLETKEPIDIKQTKYAACDECKEKVALFSDLHHQKFNFFTKCRDKVEEMRGGVEDKDSPMILEECLKDTEWMQSLFKQFEEIWQSCDRIR